VRLDSEESIIKYFNNAELRLQEKATKNSFATWAYKTNITDETQGSGDLCFQCILTLILKAQ
jgi:hypothetical protein